MPNFEITVGSADDVQRMARWAADEGWNPGNTDTHAFFAADPGAFRIGRLDSEPVVCISVVKYGQALGFLGFYIARPQVRDQVRRGVLRGAPPVRAQHRLVMAVGIGAHADELTCVSPVRTDCLVL